MVASGIEIKGCLYFVAVSQIVLNTNCHQLRVKDASSRYDYSNKNKLFTLKN